VAHATPLLQLRPDETARGDSYARRRPEETVFYQTIAEHWPGFQERMEEQGGLPKFVVREFEQYLDCGILERACLLLECRRCGHRELVGLSCKCRGFCCSCIGRRMADTAVHLEREVLPEVPIRHWICSLPWGLRALLGYERELCAAVLNALVAELSRSLKWRAKKEYRLASVADAFTGVVSSVQRVDSAVRLNVHFHLLVLDGVYVREDASNMQSPLVFRELPAPTQAEVAEVARRTTQRVEKLLQARGRSLVPGQSDAGPVELQLDHPALAACYDAAALGIGVSGDRAGQPTLRLFSSDRTKPAGGESLDEPVAEVSGFSLYAKQVVHGRDRQQVERLCRYITRPPIAQDRLSRRSDGTLQLELKNPWKDGTRALVLSPDDLLVRLCAAVPPPRFHLVRYFGVLSSHSSLRSEVVPQHPYDECAHRAASAPGDQLELLGELEEGSPKGSRHRWAWLLAHVFQADLDHCPKCQGPMRWAQVAKTPEAATRLMAEQGMAPAPLRPRAGVAVEQLRLPFDT
jgi:hypothetical protein